MGMVAFPSFLENHSVLKVTNDTGFKTLVYGVIWKHLSGSDRLNSFGKGLKLTEVLFMLTFFFF